MQKRESFRIEVSIPFEGKSLPAPRECASLTTVGFNMYLIGGFNHDACREVMQGKIFSPPGVSLRTLVICKQSTSIVSLVSGLSGI